MCFIKILIQPYQQAYEAEKEEYDKKMEEYNKTHASKKSDPDKPKKPLSAYFRFNNEKRAEVKAANPGSFSSSY